MTEIPEPADRQGPAPREIERARVWLAKRGVRVAHPTRFLGVRIGGLQTGAGSTMVVSYLIFMPLAVAGTVGYLALQKLLGVQSVRMTESTPLYFVFCALQLVGWRLGRLQERAVGKRLAVRSTSRPWREVLGGWYLAALSITFGGGALLGIAMVVTTSSARTYAWSWLGLLAIGAICTAVILRSVLRAPAVADDEASSIVDELLHTEYADATLPAMYTMPVLLDLLLENRQPHAFTGLLVAYAVLSVGVQTVGVLRHRRRALPPGNYGQPYPLPGATEPIVGWAPPKPA